MLHLKDITRIFAVLLLVLTLCVSESVSQKKRTARDDSEAPQEFLPVESISSLRKVEGFEDVSLRIRKTKARSSEDESLGIAVNTLEIMNKDNVLFSITFGDFRKDLQLIGFGSGQDDSDALSIGYVVDRQGNIRYFSAGHSAVTGAVTGSFIAFRDFEEGRWHWNSARYMAQNCGSKDYCEQMIDVDFDGFFDAKTIFSKDRKKVLGNFIFMDGGWKEVDVFVDAERCRKVGKIINRQKVYFDYDEKEGWKVGRPPKTREK